jgi:REP-associated tyrosine transposase
MGRTVRMPRGARYTPGGLVFHVLNRSVGRRTLFDKDADYLAFERVIEETLRTRPIRICAYCLMPNHWHFILWPRNDGDLAAFMQQLTNTHVKRWKEHRQEIGYGHLYQGRYKCFPVQEIGRVAQPFGFRPHRSVRAAFPHTAPPEGYPRLLRGAR